MGTRPRRRRRLAGSAVAVALAAGVSGCATAVPTTSAVHTATHTATHSAVASAPTAASAPTSPTVLQRRYEAIVRTVLPSVVQVKTGRSLGSGVVYDAGGDIVTNAHVVSGSTHFLVRPATGGKPLHASPVGVYKPADIAVIHTSGASHLRPATFADSNTLQVGQVVIAMGNPLGLQGSVTQGIISALGRTVHEPQGRGSPGAVLPGAIQTSAAINPGNSGGALINLAGKVVGIPTLAAVDPQIGGQAPGIGFAIPSNTVTNVAKQLIATGKVTHSKRAALGVTVQTVVGYSGRPAGVEIVRVKPGGGAAKAGLRPGEVIRSVAGHKTPSVKALQDVLVHHKPGDTVAVAVATPSGGHKTVQVTLGQLTTG
ncbi:MAG: S1C family serine protease [Streptosporangiaceae bacterium]